MNNPRILIFDLETAPIEAYVWALWDQNIGLDQIKSEWSILAYGAKWLGEKDIFYGDTSGGGKDRIRDDSKLLEGIWELFDKADIVVAQNGAKFDVKKLNARLMMHGFPPYSPIRVIDTLVASRKYFGFSSNKLAWLSRWLTTAPKSDHRKFPGFELWVECLRDNPEAWKEMKRYNIRDVIACEQLYLKLRPWIANHPNLGAYKEGITKQSCPKCGSTKMQKRGITVTQQGQYQRYQCNKCAGWSRGKELLLPLEERKALLV